jgi:L-alanine-DL-glutamate epimerase-like enolase superfamily enzyme
MRVTRVEAIPVRLPLTKPLIMGGRRYEQSESLLVHVGCDHGIEGWGEAAPYAAHGEQLSTLVAEVVHTIAPFVQGRRLADRAQILTDLQQVAQRSPRAIAAVEIALADTLARASGACGSRICTAALGDTPSPRSGSSVLPASMTNWPKPNA